MDSFTTPLIPAQVHQAFQTLMSAMGAPRRRSLSASEYYRLSTSPVADADRLDYFHPVFGLMAHFRAHDDGERGYTSNPYRGDHVSIPGYSEMGMDPVVFEMSFHKGATFFELVTFPDADPTIARAAYELLDGSETR